MGQGSPQSTSHPQRRCLPSQTWNSEWEFGTEKQREWCSRQKAQPGKTAGILPSEPPSSPLVSDQISPPQRGLPAPSMRGEPSPPALHQGSFFPSLHLGQSYSFVYYLSTLPSSPGAGTLSLLLAALSQSLARHLAHSRHRTTCIEHDLNKLAPTLCLSFLVCEMSITTTHTSQGCCKN